MQVSNGASSGKKTSYDKAHAKKVVSKNKDYIGNSLANPRQVGHGKAGAFDLFKKGYKALDKANNAQLFNHKGKKEKGGKSYGSSQTAYGKMKSIENASKSIKTTPVASHKSTNSTHSTPVASHKSTNSTHSKPVAKSSISTKSKSSSANTPTKSVKSKSPTKSTLSLAQKKQAYLKSLKNSSDSYYKDQVAGYAKARDNAILQQKQSYQNAVDEGKISQQEANDLFAKDKKAIDQSFYKQSQATNITAYDNGIQNSMQMLGLQAGDNARQQESVDTATSTRDQQINDIKNRLASLASTRDLNIAGINSDYGNSITQARSQADKMYNDGVNTFNANDYSATQQHNWDVQDATTAYNHQLALQNANHTNGSSGSGSKSRSGYKPSKSVKTIANAYNNYRNTKQNTGLDQYYKSQTALNKGSVVQKNPALPPVSLNYNQTLSPWQKYKIVMGG